MSDRSNRTRTLRIARQWRSGDDKTIDATRVSLLLNELRLPAIKHVWMRFAERSDKEGRPASRGRKVWSQPTPPMRSGLRLSAHVPVISAPASAGRRV